MNPMKQTIKNCLGAFAAFFLLPLAAEVAITEFMADNGSTRPTAAGTFEDWIELTNDGTTAVDLTGWRMGSSTKMSAGKGWTFPANTMIPAGGHLLVFADKLDCVTNGELHANFKLSKVGNDDHLWLVDAEGNVKSDYGAYPQQIEDVSYGLGHREVTLVGAGTPVTYMVNSVSSQGFGGIGFASNMNAGFQCTRYAMNTTVDSVSKARTCINNSAYWSGSPVTKYYDTVAFVDSSATVSFTSVPHNQCPGWENDMSDHNNFVLLTTGQIYIPEPGVWTFALASDDGFEFRLTGYGRTFSSDVGSRSFAQTLLQCDIPSAGAYSLEFLWYEQSGGASCELSAAKGSFSSFDTTNFKLVGAPDSPITHAGSISKYIDTDIKSAMLNRSSQVTADWTFTLDHAPIAGDSARLELRYADACQISLNGHAVTSFNMNSWGGGAASQRLAEDVTLPITVTVPAAYFVEGANTLRILGYNNSVADGDFLLAPVLVYSEAQVMPTYFKTPTPGAANVGQTFSGPTPLVVASEPRGYKTKAFDVTLSCPEKPDAAIYYTLDGTEPSATHGTRYTGPIHVSRTTYLRAALPQPDSVLQRTTCYTWLFMSDILTQSSATPAGWPSSGSVNGQTMKYGLNSTTLNNDRARFINGITNAPHVATLSLVCNLADLFGSGTGIYVYPGNQGRGWERPVSIECIDPVHGTNNEFQINAGIRIRGAASRSTGNPKHSFHVFFREEYGTASKLNFPLFGEEGATSFKKIDLRSEQNHSWHTTNERSDTLVRDVFSRDSQRDMGEIAYGRSRYYHLYINGQYWGIYQTEERPEENFGESYFGTEKTHWDVIKKNHDRQLECTNGSLDAYNQLFSLAISQGFSGSYANNYWKVQGLNADGSTNLTYRPLLNINGLLNYVFITHFTADGDSPVSAWSDFSNNINMLYDQTGANRGFFWLHHDSEHSMGATNGKVDINDATYGYRANIFDWGTPRDHSNFNRSENLNPLGIHDKLTAHPRYKRQLADAIQRTFFNNGPLTVANAKARVQARMNEIDEAVVGEAVRWGNGCTRTDWLNACEQVMRFIELRHPVLMDQYRAKGWLPSVEAPQASLENGSAATLGSTFTLGAKNVFYYTTDGSDPVDENGVLSPSAIRVENTSSDIPTPRTIFAKTSEWAYYDWGQQPPNDSMGRAWNTLDFVSSSQWAKGPGILGVLGNNGTAVGTATHRYINHATSGTQVTTTYFRREFELAANETAAEKMTIEMLFDDGYVLYINGQEVDRLCMNAGTVTYDTWANTTIGTSGTYTQNTYASRTVTIPAGILQAGKNVIAAEVHQIHGTSTDLYWDCSLATTAASYTSTQSVTTEIELRGTGVSLKARAYNGSEWSALTELAYTTTAPVQDRSGLKISEIMHAPNKADNIAPYDEDSFSWIELQNVGTTTINLFGCTLAGEKFTATFGDVEIVAGERFVVSGNPEAFALVHPRATSRVFCWEAGGSLKRKGDTLTLTDPTGTVLSTVTYSNTWFDGASYNTGFSLVARDLTADQTQPAFSQPDAWKVGTTRFGTPGRPERPRLTSIRRGEGVTILFTGTDLESDWDLYFTTNLTSETIWTLCPATRYTLENGVLTLTPYLRGTSRPLYNAPQAFFRLVPKEEEE